MCELCQNLCESCVNPIKSLEHITACNPCQQLDDLFSFGYIPAPELRSFGGPFVVRRPDRTPISEGEFGRELEQLLVA